MQDCSQLAAPVDLGGEYLGELVCERGPHPWVDNDVRWRSPRNDINIVIKGTKFTGLKVAVVVLVGSVFIICSRSPNEQRNQKTNHDKSKKLALTPRRHNATCPLLPALLM